MGINDLTIGQARELAAMLGSQQSGKLDNFAIGQTVIIRTYSAGVWCGILEQKAGNEVVLKNARRMWRWWCARSISLSGVAAYGIRQDKSKIAPPVESVWLEAIEILPVTGDPARSIMEAPVPKLNNFIGYGYGSGSGDGYGDGSGDGDGYGSG